MKKNTTIILIITALLFQVQSLLRAGAEKVIYGDDNRVDYYAMPKNIQKIADSVVSLWDSGNIQYNSSTAKYKVKTKKFKDALNLCEEEPFKEQPIGAFCSGALISEDTIITAGHCITSENKCASTYFVFGYAAKNLSDPSKVQTEFSYDDVYRCAKVIRTHVGPEPTPDNPQGIGLGPDYAIVKLDRKVVGRKPLKINTNQKLSVGMEMYVIGYPVGLPVKYADGAWVRDPSPDGYFVANLDTYGGNSGSPVFNAKTNLIEGILVRGDNDFVQTPLGCRISNRVENNGGRGEDVTKISVLYRYLNGIVDGILIKETERSIKITPSFDIDYSKAIKFSFD